ncbi:MAG: DUF6569 family protein [Pirellulales bacterium]
MPSLWVKGHRDRAVRQGDNLSQGMGRVLSGFIVDALPERDEKHIAVKADVEQASAATKDANWDQVDPIGEDEEYRAEIEQDHAAVLCFEAELVHGSVVAV